MEPIWLQHYEPGVRDQIDVQVYDTVAALLADSVVQYGPLRAYTHQQHSLTFAELATLATDFAAYLQHDLHLKRGERVALMLPNVLAYPVVFLGVLCAGGVVVNISPNLHASDVAYRLTDSGARVLVVADGTLPLLLQTWARPPLEHILTAPVQGIPHTRHGHILDWIWPWNRSSLQQETDGRISLASALKRGQEQTPVLPALNADDLALLQYTDGTTARPKAAELTHGNLIANMLQAAEWVKNTLHPGKETAAVILPFYHIFSLTLHLLLGLRLGAHQVLLDNPRDTATVVKTLSEYPISAISGIDGLFRALLYQRAFAGLDFSTWKVALAGDLPVQRATAEAWYQLTGVAITEAYGLTEAGPGACAMPLHLKLTNGSVGVPVPNTEVQIRDASGQILPAGEVGELWIRGPQVMRGYWMRPEETARVLDDQDYLATGDVAVMDASGFVFIKGRCRDIIHIKGVAVYPEEIERSLMSLPGVRAVACVGMPDGGGGELIKLYVVRTDAQVDASAVLAHCQYYLPAQQWPHDIEFVESLPYSAIGKLRREELRQTVAAKCTVT